MKMALERVALMMLKNVVVMLKDAVMMYSWMMLMDIFASQLKNMMK
jgi:hypothetical protein